MTRSITPTRAVLRAATPALGIAVLACACPAQAFTPTAKHGTESTPLNISASTGSTHVSTGGPSLVRTIVGLLIVIAVIWGLTWILRQVKSGRVRSSGGSGLTSMATLPLGSGRTLHLVRAGRDYLLLGSAEHVDPSWAAPRIVRLWSQRSRVRTKEELILPHVAYLLELEKRGDVKVLTLEEIFGY